MASRALQNRIGQVKPCSQCAEHGGLWVPGANGGQRRCSCLRGRLLEMADRGSAKTREAEDVGV